MGLKKAWIYDSALPASIADELIADGYESPSSPGVRASFEEKQAALEKYSLSALGDLVQEKEHEWVRNTAAIRAHQLKARMTKLQAKSRRASSWSSYSMDESTRRELGLDEYGVWPELDNTGCRAEADKASRRSSYSGAQFPDLEHKNASSEPFVIDTVEDLVLRLDKMGRLQPPISSLTKSSMPTDPAPSINCSEMASEPGDSSFASHSSAGNESDTSSDEPSVNPAPEEEVLIADTSATNFELSDAE